MNLAHFFCTSVEKTWYTENRWPSQVSSFAVAALTMTCLSFHLSSRSIILQGLLSGAGLGLSARCTRSISGTGLLSGRPNHLSAERCLSLTVTPGFELQPCLLPNHQCPSLLPPSCRERLLRVNGIVHVFKFSMKFMGPFWSFIF